jgi:hypothetical protein
MLVRSGRYKERFVMKRKENVVRKDEPSDVLEEREVKGEERNKDSALEKSKDGGGVEEQRVLLMEDGKLKPFSPDDYTASTLYQVVESFSVECRLVRPEDPGNLVFEGKRPTKKTQPIIVTKGGDSLLLESWESLESNPEQLSDAAEVIGALPVKQVFVLRRK